MPAGRARVQPPSAAGICNALPIVKMPLMRSAGTLSAVAIPCANTHLRMTRGTPASPRTRQPSGGGAKPSKGSRMGRVNQPW